jgi:hypothetical protein
MSINTRTTLFLVAAALGACAAPSSADYDSVQAADAAARARSGKHLLRIDYEVGAVARVAIHEERAFWGGEKAAAQPPTGAFSLRRLTQHTVTAVQDAAADLDVESLRVQVVVDSPVGKANYDSAVDGDVPRELESMVGAARGRYSWSFPTTVGWIRFNEPKAQAGSPSRDKGRQALPKWLGYELPSHPVAVGESWTSEGHELALGPVGKVAVVYTYTLASVDDGSYRIETRADAVEEDDRLSGDESLELQAHGHVVLSRSTGVPLAMQWEAKASSAGRQTMHYEHTQRIESLAEGADLPALASTAEGG